MNQKRLKLVIISIAIFIITILLLVFTFKELIKNPLTSLGDPGNKQLIDLKSDAIFYVQPPGIQMNGSITQIPAQYRLIDAASTSNAGPEVKENFVSDSSIPEIYQFYEKLAAKDGWHMRNSWTNGYAETWTKTFAGNVTGFLSLENSKNDPNGQIYTLSASITETSN